LHHRTTFTVCGAKPSHHSARRTRPDAKNGVAAGRVRPATGFAHGGGEKCPSVTSKSSPSPKVPQVHKSTSSPSPQKSGKVAPRCVPLHHKVHKVHQVQSRRWRNCTVWAFAPPPDDSEAVVRSLCTVSEAGRAKSDASGRVRTHKMDAQNGRSRTRPSVRGPVSNEKCASSSPISTNFRRKVVNICEIEAHSFFKNSSGRIRPDASVRTRPDAAVRPDASGRVRTRPDASDLARPAS